MIIETKKGLIDLKDNYIFIKGNVPSSKNSKQWTGRYLISNKPTQNYKKLYYYQYLENKRKFKDMIKNIRRPYNITFYFIRDSKRRFDYVNVAQLPLDLMVDSEWIDDDNSDYIRPIFTGYEVNKLNAGLIIGIEEINNEKNKA